MGSSHSRPLFSACTDQSQMQGLITEERKGYDEKQLDLVMKLIGKGVEDEKDGRDAGKVFEESDSAPEQILQLFLEGVTECQAKLDNKKYPEFQELGKLLEEYFDHGLDKNTKKHITEIRAKLTEWFSKH